jgi:DNA-directed RNA polymerase alpha subunit
MYSSHLEAPDNTLLKMLDLPPRLLNALASEGITTVGAVRKLSDFRLRSIRGIGDRSYRLLRKMCGPSRQSRLGGARPQSPIGSTLSPERQRQLVVKRFNEGV